MDGGPVVWVFSTMAFVESVFWGNVAACLKKDGNAVVFLCFDDRSAEYLAGLGFDVYTTNMEDRRLATSQNGKGMDISGITSVSIYGCL